MKDLNEISHVSPAKMEALKARMARLQIQTQLIDEKFVRGGGKGGQKVNKTANAVSLRYPPLNLVVKVHRERQRSLNRFLALRELVDQIEMIISPHTSARKKEWDKIRKQKKHRRRKKASFPEKEIPDRDIRE